jgi:hypothetical protein
MVGGLTLDRQPTLESARKSNACVVVALATTSGGWHH